jgi:hypothetical protein
MNDSQLDDPSERNCLAESEFVSGKADDDSLFDLCQRSRTMRSFDDLLGNMIDIGNALVNNESERSRIPWDVGDCGLRPWGFSEHAVTMVPPKTMVSTNQKSELMAAWNGDAVNAASEFRLTT